MEPVVPWFSSGGGSTAGSTVSGDADVAILRFTIIFANASSKLCLLSEPVSVEVPVLVDTDGEDCAGAARLKSESFGAASVLMAGFCQDARGSSRLPMIMGHSFYMWRRLHLRQLTSSNKGAIYDKSSEALNYRTLSTNAAFHLDS
jgi:hypothetical protein